MQKYPTSDDKAIGNILLHTVFAEVSYLMWVICRWVWEGLRSDIDWADQILPPVFGSLSVGRRAPDRGAPWL